MKQLIAAHRGASQFRESRRAYGQVEVHQVAHQVGFKTDVSPERRVDLLVENRPRYGPYRFAGRPHVTGGFRLAAGTGVRVQDDQVRGIESIQPVRVGQHGHGEVPFHEGNCHVVGAGEVVGEDVKGRGRRLGFHIDRKVPSASGQG